MSENKKHKFFKDKDLLLQQLAKEIDQGLLGKKTGIISRKAKSAIINEPKLDIDDRLFLAILLDSKDIVQQLLDLGADANATNKQDTSVLQLALAFKRDDIARLLLDNGAMPHFIKLKTR